MTGWTEADRLFRDHPQWVGGDAAYSAPVGDDRAVWVFMDSLVTPEPGMARTDAVFLNNSVAMQEGLDPTTATMHYRWGPSDAAGKPTSFFPPMGESYLWPGNLVLVGDALLISLMKVRHRAWEPDPDAGPLDIGPLNSFDVHDWVAAIVDNPRDDPSDWRVRYAASPPCPHATIFGTGGLQVRGDHLWSYALGAGGAVLCRWVVADVVRGDLAAREWWCGDRWLPEGSGEPASFGPAPTEFTVHEDAASGVWIWAQVDGLYDGEVSLAFADRMQGPWSARTVVHRPVEHGRRDAFVYGGKAHVEQRAPGGELVLTYNNNGAVGVDQIMADPSLYYPTFVLVDVDAQLAAHSSRSSGVPSTPR
jgi:hypothetical protein